MNIRLQKFLAEAGIASRRAGERLMSEGRIKVDGVVATELGTRVDPERQRITFDDKPVKAQRKFYLALNKPRGVLSSRTDPSGRRTVLDLLPREWSMVYPVGRLDADTEGLLLLTNDGDFCLHVTHPRYGVRKRYVATVEGRIDAHGLSALTRGVVHEGERLKAERARLLGANNTHSVVELELAEGRNREVRRLFEVLNLVVVQLQRLQIGPIKLGELPSGRWRTLSPAEVRSLMQATVAPRAPHAPGPPAPEPAAPAFSPTPAVSDGVGMTRTPGRPRPARKGRPFPPSGPFAKPRVAARGPDRSRPERSGRGGFRAAAPGGFGGGGGLRRRPRD